MRILGINLLLVTERPSAVAVNQRSLLNYSFPVYSRRQVRDLCDECPGCLGEVVTREGGGKGGGRKPQRDSTGDVEEQEEENCQFVRLRCSGRFGAAFAFHAFNFNSAAGSAALGMAAWAVF